MLKIVHFGDPFEVKQKGPSSPNGVERDCKKNLKEIGISWKESKSKTSIILGEKEHAHLVPQAA